jgi:hypothetical protein
MVDIAVTVAVIAYPDICVVSGVWLSGVDVSTFEGDACSVM